MSAKAFFEKVDTGFSQKNATKQEIRAVDCVNQNKNRSRSPTILILGGSEIAYQLAQELQSLPVRVISSLAGRTQNPRLPAGEWRLGGFGGVQGLVHFLAIKNIDLLIDATHPFARTIQDHAAAAERISAVPLLRLRKAAWQPVAGDNWIEVEDERAAAAVPPQGVDVFLALGRQHLAAFLSRHDVNFIARMIEKPDNLEQFENVKIILGRPGTENDEVRLFQEHKIDMLVCRNSGAHASYAKIAAARTLSLPVVMITPPAPTANIPTLESVEVACDFIKQSLRLDR